ncbi:aminotransferase class I/II-fold pyridoxal phosphate-dependent enzyme [Hymenobacter sp. YC55]|uniref:pyridoxal phosphate-dependent aminotransferase n=1 Tax=Hymenobacter sp. YC55 TaxID=3034019 RepID=UPI0023F86321|nr:aminotransferase class I/II-fold pyridoxal phosphate-dependent enzyme [Hymenobacter sp. YC55]MDF7812200.1 aminotransferase class I/II-fold pyridoxal phosphate-dependent enzyme [Hymenobacter sp. YC55]
MSLISLASGYGNFLPASEVTSRVLNLLHVGRLPISPVEGLPTLRETLAANYHQQGGPPITPMNIVVTPGTKAALFALLCAVLHPGDEVLLPTPNWFGFWELIERAGGVIRELPLSIADDYALTPELLQAAMTPRTRVLLFTNPNNPTGRIYQRTEVEALLAVTRQHPQLFVLSDEIYDGICFDSEVVPSLLSFPDPNGQHLVVNGFSKSLTLLGWNVGYLVAPPAVARACAQQQFATGGAVAVPSQIAALAATEARPSITTTLRQQLLPNRQRLLDFLATLPGALPHAPGGTYYAFPDLRAFIAPDLAPAEASAQLMTKLKAAGVVVVDGATCGAPGFARLSYAVPAAELTEAIRRLAAVLQ